MATLDELFEALYLAGHDDVGTKATSLRLPQSVHRATTLATELGMARSFTAATTEALLDRLRAFARQQALAGHLADFPDDQPPLSAVVRRRVAGTDHPAAHDPETADRVAAWLARRHPDWAVSGDVDATVDRVLEHLELLAEDAAGGGSSTGPEVSTEGAGSAATARSAPGAAPSAQPR